MIKVSKSTALHLLIRLLGFIAMAKIISLVALWYLPSDGVELSVKTNKQPKYRRIDFANMIKDIKDIKDVKAPKFNADGSPIPWKGAKNISITSMILKGLYGSKKNGYAILALKASAKKTSIISVGESFSSYKLKLIKPKGVVFTKAGKEYVLNLLETKQISSITKANAKGKTIDKAKPASLSVTEPTSNISREEISYYTKNPKQLWKDIKIVDHKKNKKLVGFRVKRINQDSKFAALGLQVGDIIIKANNVVLKSYKDVFNIYNKIDKLDTVQIVVLRDNQEKEFVYEIN